MLRDQRDAQVVFGEVVGIDLAARRVAVQTLDQRAEITYDSLIVTTGASRRTSVTRSLRAMRPA